MLRPSKRVLIFSIVLVLVVGACAAGDAYYRNHSSATAVERFHDRTHDTALINTTNARLDAEMASNVQVLTPQLTTFGLSFLHPPKSTCNEGDPTLYKYSCSTLVHMDVANQEHTISTAPDAAEKLTILDKFMTSNGWKIGHNDFRTQQPQPATEWTTTIASYPVDIEYGNGDCELEFEIKLPAQPADGASASDMLSCDEDLLPGFYF